MRVGIAIFVSEHEILLDSLQSLFLFQNMKSLHESRNRGRNNFVAAAVAAAAAANSSAAAAVASDIEKDVGGKLVRYFLF